VCRCSHWQFGIGLPSAYASVCFILSPHHLSDVSKCSNCGQLHVLQMLAAMHESRYLYSLVVAFLLVCTTFKFVTHLFGCAAASDVQ